MSSADPWDVVVADLCGPPGRVLWQSRRRRRQPVASIRSGHPFTAKAETVRCVKQRSLPGRCLFAVEFADVDGQPGRWLSGVEERDDGWAVTGGAGGSGSAPRRDHPWVNLAGWWGPDGFYAGGAILSGDGVASVRLTTDDGVVLHDDTEAGIVLFLTDAAVEVPVRVELLDAAGETLATQLEFDF